MEAIYHKGTLIGDIEKGERKGSWFATDTQGNNSLLNSKKEAIEYLKNK